MRILHLEHSAHDAELIAHRLEEEGIACQITRIETREDFLTAAERGDWDVILADYGLPSLDGISALKIAREKCPDIPFIFVSGTLGEEVAVTTLKSGATDYILKDRLARLPLAVERAVEERAVLEARKRAEALLNLRTQALEAAANGIVITDRDGAIIWANAACAALTGYTPGELLGKNPRILKSGREDETLYRNLWTTILNGQVWRGEIVNRRKDGSLYTEEMTITPLRDPQGSITSFVAIKQDITERKSLEEQLRQAHKLEAMGRLAGRFADDFNNLLALMTGYSDLLLEAARCAGDRGDAGEMKAERRAELNRRLRMSGQEVIPQPRVLNLNEIVSNLQEKLRRLIGEDVELNLVLGHALGSVKVDVGQLRQIIVNLAVNARDAMPKGGRLLIQTARASVDEVSSKKRVGMKPGPYVVLSVSDTGCGMDEQVRARIFEPFFTTKEKGEGAGLGLATAYGIVKEAGGAISVDSEPNKGSTFKIYLPSVAEQPEATHRARSRKGDSTPASTVSRPR
jgi:two-component system, cell cycle sensor histidine kinase and response regulator CckA